MEKQKKDPSQNFIARSYEPLDALFYPKTVAVIGAKDNIGSVGRTILMNLLNEKFTGTVYPVNPKRKEVLGIKAYPSLHKIPEKIDLAVIVTPAKTVPQIIQDCIDTNVRSAIIISAGFKEIGAKGLKMEEKILSIAHQGNLPIIGPNCLGVMNPITGLNATFAKGTALPGNIAFISQSGAMCTAVLDWSFQQGVGFSSFVSLGSMADINWGHLLHYLGEDPHTHSILMYMETVGDPQAFLTAAREIALDKPIIVIKGGRSKEAAQAAASHTGSLAGSDDVFNAALLRAGVLRVNTISELFDMASVLSRQPLPQGPNLAIITNAGGPSVLATDAATLNGAKITTLCDTTIKSLNAFLPEAWSQANPIDILGDADAERYEKSIEIISKDPNIDGILVILSPQDVTDPLRTAECLRSFSKIKKPILASWMGGDTVSKGKHLLQQAGIPSFSYPDDAAWAFATMWKYSNNLKTLYETPSLRDEDTAQGHTNISLTAKAANIIEQAKNDHRELLDEYESKAILESYKIPTVQTVIAKTKEEAIKAANEIGYPVVLKLFSKTITHKTDVGGVILNLNSPKQVSQAFEQIELSVSEKIGKKAFEGTTVQKMVQSKGYEIIIGSSCDEQFGPTIVFGTGGELVEIYQDRALGLPPLNLNLAYQLMKKTKIFEAMQGFRGKKAIDIEKLANILVHFSQLIVENPLIKEMDINPILASSEEIIAVDARVLLHSNKTKVKKIPKTAICPYPVQYIQTIQLTNGQTLLLRPIKAEDEPLMIEFHKELSENSVRQRFFEFLNLDERTAHKRLIKICFNDYNKELAIVALTPYENSEKTKIIGVGRLSKIYGTASAQMTMIIADKFHKKGLGNQLLKSLIHIAKKEGIKEIRAEVLSENKGMLHLCKKEGFKIQFMNHLALLTLILD